MLKKKIKFVNAKKISKMLKKMKKIRSAKNSEILKIG
jgi:hypothetical protein